MSCRSRSRRRTARWWRSWSANLSPSIFHAGCSGARPATSWSWAQPERIALGNYGENVFAVGLRATLPADGSAVAAWGIDTQRPGGLGGSVSTQIVASIAGPSAAFGPPQPLTPASALFGYPVVASAGGEAFVATAQTHGRLLLATRSAGAAVMQAPVTLDDDVNGDVLLAAAGTHVVAGYQKDNRLRLRVR